MKFILKFALVLNRFLENLRHSSRMCLVIFSKIRIQEDFVSLLLVRNFTDYREIFS